MGAVGGWLRRVVGLVFGFGVGYLVCLTVTWVFPYGAYGLVLWL